MTIRFALALAFSTALAPAMAADVTYRNDIRPLIKAQCDECHGDTAPTLAEFKLAEERYKKEKVGPRTNTYADLVQLISWPDTGALMRRLDDGKNSKDGKPGNMYQYLGGTEEERQRNLDLFKNWVGSWSLKRWADTTKDELNGIKVKY